MEHMEPYLERLKEKFDKALTLRSNRNQTEFKTAWEIIVRSHETRHYHNLYLTHSDLLINCDGIPVYITDEMVMASFFKYVKFHPKNHEYVHSSADYMKTVLFDLFGWDEIKVKKVARLIKESEEFVDADPNNFDHELFLLRDMKMARLAKPYSNFINDRNYLIAELNPHFSIPDIYVAEYKLFKILQKRKRLFLTTVCRRSFDEAARDNIDKRVNWFVNECSIIREKIDRKELIT